VHGAADVSPITLPPTNFNISLNKCVQCSTHPPIAWKARYPRLHGISLVDIIQANAVNKILFEKKKEKEEEKTICGGNCVMCDYSWDCNSDDDQLTTYKSLFSFHPSGLPTQSSSRHCCVLSYFNSDCTNTNQELPVLLAITQ
jgi:hypothetical protein